MVFLTSRLLLRKKRMTPYADAVWKKEMYRKLSWNFRNRMRNCYALSRRDINHSLRDSTTGAPTIRNEINYIFSHRIAAGCGQFGIQYSSFMKALYESNIALNRKMLSHLSTYEPRTFQSLCEFVKKKHTENVQKGLASVIEPTASGIITRDMMQKVVQE